MISTPTARRTAWQALFLRPKHNGTPHIRSKGTPKCGTWKLKKTVQVRSISGKMLDNDDAANQISGTSQLKNNPRQLFLFQIHASALSTNIAIHYHKQATKIQFIVKFAIREFNAQIDPTVCLRWAVSANATQNPSADLYWRSCVEQDLWFWIDRSTNLPLEAAMPNMAASELIFGSTI